MTHDIEMGKTSNLKDRENLSSCQKMMEQVSEILSYLFYCNEDDEIHFMWKDDVSVEHVLRNQPELRKLFRELYFYDSSYTKGDGRWETRIEEKRS